MKGLGMMGVPIAAFLAGHIVQAKFGTIGKIGNVVGKIPVVGDKLEDLIDKLE